jgi:hypothetical protein
MLLLAHHERRGCGDGIGIGGFEGSNNSRAITNQSNSRTGAVDLALQSLYTLTRV